MTHLLVMILFAALVGTVMGLISRETAREQFRYGLKVFGEFVVIGLVLAWVLYFLPV
jgi:undecaprenyl pyrophosphate phosphatase UppP